MELRTHDLVAASVRMVPLVARHPKGAESWQRELAFAHEELGAAPPDHSWPLPAALPERDRPGELEPCGVPGIAAAAQHGHQSAATLAPSSASGCPDSPREAQTQLPERACEHVPVPVPVRVHVDHHDARGTTVWLGLDGSRQRVDEHAARIVSGLRQALQATPERLAAVVCNGATVYAAAAPAPVRTQRPCGVFATASLKDLP